MIPSSRSLLRRGRASLKRPATVAHGVLRNTWWPMESQYVISVGGTDLTTKGPGKGWASETVWVDGGGGISPDDFPIPSWQKLKGVITKANKGSTKYRNGPDVSANSNFTFYVCADQRGCTANELRRDQLCRAHVGRLPGSGQPTGCGSQR